MSTKNRSSFLKKLVSGTIGKHCLISFRGYFVCYFIFFKERTCVPEPGCESHQTFFFVAYPRKRSKSVYVVWDTLGSGGGGIMLHIVKAVLNPNEEPKAVALRG